jgi:hypothetical protein
LLLLRLLFFCCCCCCCVCYFFAVAVVVVFVILELVRSMRWYLFGKTNKFETVFEMSPRYSPCSFVYCFKSFKLYFCLSVLRLIKMFFCCLLNKKILRPLNCF